MKEYPADRENWRQRPTGYDKVLRVSRTIADLDESPEIEVHHLNEAVNFRLLDRQMWV